MPVEDEASEPESHSTPTLDDLYDSLNFRDNFRLFRYGIRVDNALGEIDIHAGHFNARLRRAVKIMGMREGWSPQEVAAAVSDGFYDPAPFPILERWKQQGKFRVEQLDRFAELCVRAVQAAFGCDLRDFLESPDRAKRFLHDLRNPDELEDMLIRLEEITGESIRAKLDEAVPGEPLSVNSEPKKVQKSLWKEEPSDIEDSQLLRRRATLSVRYAVLLGIAAAAAYVFLPLDQWWSILILFLLGLLCLGAIVEVVKCVQQLRRSLP